MPKIIYSVWALIAHGRGNECPGGVTKCKSVINKLQTANLMGRIQPIRDSHPARCSDIRRHTQMRRSRAKGVKDLKSTTLILNYRIKSVTLQL